ncbi:MAG: DUF3488 and transglutaminase-like domain-containing protein [Proteobacteria bacterium]|nr:DUF3488 and transglutaminase-like domain-containing protein [Pseudomonadota bacterium]
MKPRNPYLGILTLAVAVATLPHLFSMPGWVSAFCLVSWGFLFLAPRRGWAMPGAWARRALAVTLAIAVVYRFQGLASYLAPVSLLSAMACLKLMEVHNHRDRMATVFMTFFLAVSSLLISKSLQLALYMVGSLVFTSAVLIQINHPGGRMKSHLSLAARILVQALPVALLLFLAFPRFQGGLWGRAWDQRSTGLSDTLTMGAFSSLAENNEPAFRVAFDTEPPPRRDLYWRALTLSRFDGKTWSSPTVVPPMIHPVTGSRPVSCTVVLEPHSERWLMALDVPARAPEGAVLRSDFTLTANRRVQETFRYHTTSFLAPARLAESAGPFLSLQLPPGGNPRARRLAAEWAGRAASPAQVADMAIAYFRKNDFVYTLAPGTLGRDPVDAFLFETRQGFCEHFAASFAFLMRAAGVPCRVVVGYQGAQKNPFGNYYIVRQSDAHAWTEIWLADRGWVRVDPVSAVAPARLNRDVRDLMDKKMFSLMYRWLRMGPLARPLEEFGFAWDLVNTRWREWVMDYTHKEQAGLLERLGISAKGWAGPAAALAGALALGAALATLLHFRSNWTQRPRPDRSRESWDRFCARMAQAGVARRPDEGPADFAWRVSQARPGLAAPVGEITDLYIALRYAGKEDPALSARFRDRVRTFSAAREERGGS